MRKGGLRLSHGWSAHIYVPIRRLMDQAKLFATHGVAGADVDWRHPGRNELAPREVTDQGVQERNQNCQRKGFVAALRDLIELK